jgi:hypothetical protein
MNFLVSAFHSAEGVEKCTVFRGKSSLIFAVLELTRLHKQVIAKLAPPASSLTIRATFRIISSFPQVPIRWFPILPAPGMPSLARGI